MDFISDVYSQKQWDDGNQHEVESLGIEHSLFKVLNHEDQVEAGPYGGYNGAEGVFIVVGSRQIDYKPPPEANIPWMIPAPMRITADSQWLIGFSEGFTSRFFSAAATMIPPYTGPMICGDTRE